MAPTGRQGRSRPLFSVIIPALNEAGAITPLLHCLKGPAASGLAEVIVVCNGCTDATAAAARSAGDAIQVLETPTASKTHALNLGDEVATCFPRFYLDADLRISTDDLLKVFHYMVRHQAPAASARIEYDTTVSTWMVRCFYDLWQRLPYATHHGIGVGMYALSRDGRSRFDRFPDTFADDLYVQMHFDASERATVPNGHARVPAPTNLKGLLSCRSRQYLGKKEIARLLPIPSAASGMRQSKALWRLMRRPRFWGLITLFLAVRTAAIALYWWRYRIRGKRRWSRSRAAVQESVVRA